MRHAPLTKHQKLLLIAANDPDQFVAHITYLDSHGSVTTRPISPYKLHADKVVAFCLSRNAIRSFRYKRITCVKVGLACDVLAPSELKVLVDHRKTVRRN